MMNLEDKRPNPAPGKMPVGERLNVKNAAAYRLPEPGAMIGSTRGWLLETIDRWNAARPGRGVGGGRPRKPRKDGE